LRLAFLPQTQLQPWDLLSGFCLIFAAGVETIDKSA
jgi:hypothetical protein